MSTLHHATRPVQLLPPELDDIIDDDVFWSEDSEPFHAPTEPLLPTSEWLRAQAAWYRSLDGDLATWLSVRIDDIADLWDRFGVETVPAFRRAETADTNAIYLHHQDIGRVIGLGGETRSAVIERIAAFE